MNQRHLALLAALLAPAALAACAGPLTQTPEAAAPAAPAVAVAAADTATAAAADAKTAAVDTATTAAGSASTTAATAVAATTSAATDLKATAVDTAAAAASATQSAATTAAAPAVTAAADLKAAAVPSAAPTGAAQSIEQLFRDRATLGGKEVTVRGTVVKFKAGIMGKNWLHLQDGTGAQGTNDLTVTTAADTEVGKKVLVKGVAAVNKDFGYGYKYDLIIEDADLTAE
ncbi:MAG: hypothetical protein HZB55_15540 [Deltaproteobacteria bacterium]|nr:hypothetical protein [Deltaproteobacteria bacterium]